MSVDECMYTAAFSRRNGFVCVLEVVLGVHTSHVGVNHCVTTVAVNKKFTFRIRSTIVVRNHFHSFTKRASLR